MAVVLTTTPAPGALAQTDPAQNPSGGRDAIEEITVTGQKRGPQRVRDVPAAIQAIGGNTIDDMLATEFSDLAGMIPSLQFQDLGPGDKEYIIRGVNSSGTATVGVYYDEAVITARNKQDGGGRQADIELHDLARIEVLKGPQGTLYGASSMSGTIRFIPNEADPSAVDFNVEGEISTTDNGGTNYRTNGMLNLPIIKDKLAVRAVGWISDEAGYIDNVRLGLKDINSNNVEGGRVSVRWLPTDRLELSVAALIQNRDVGGSSRFSTSYQPAYLENLQAFGFDAPALGDLTNQDFTVNDWDESIELYSVKAQYDAGFGSFFATSNYFERDVTFRFDSTPVLLFFGAPAAALTRQPQKRELWSHELRFASSLDGPVNFVIGGFLSREDKDFDVEVVATNELGLPLGPFDITKDFFLDGPPNAAIFGRTKSDELDQEALFGEVTLEATNKLSLTFGGRYFNFDIVSSGLETKPFVGFNNETRAVDISSGSDTFQIKGNASYKVNDDHLVYFTAAEGFRVGGTNDAAINPTGVPVPEGFDPDSLWNYEIGWKGGFFDNRLVVNAAAFVILWDNIQVEGLDPSGAFPIITNAGEAEIDGIEFDVTIRPIAGLDLSFGGSWQDARITESQPLSDPLSPSFDPNAGLKGDQLPNVPDFQGFAAAQYERPLTSDLDGLVRIDISYRGSVDTQFRETSPFNVPLDSYTIVNLKAGITNDHWDLSVFAKNLFDKRAQVDAINSAQDPLSFVTVRPFTFGGHVAYRF
ncbi:TonB-dependent receptor [Iodidimonas muriae]|uniref:TonB-dependent receptor n=1 Tax=Iodidimonas muriae TaxID=261467 RepID=A0ABQ2LEZ7_9PROT|nr:TonB-dependent receptor [Iodidimonas muriae]GGO14653.1 TonB-dependent receptor [Iodidimonas muriae]